MIRLLVRTTSGSTRARMDLTGDIAGATVDPISSDWESDRCPGPTYPREGGGNRRGNRHSPAGGFLDLATALGDP